MRLEVGGDNEASHLLLIIVSRVCLSLSLSQEIHIRHSLWLENLCQDQFTIDAIG